MRKTRRSVQIFRQPSQRGVGDVVRRVGLGIHLDVLGVHPETENEDRNATTPE